jgi:hypothetical protein
MNAFNLEDGGMADDSGAGSDPSWSSFGKPGNAVTAPDAPPPQQGGQQGGGGSSALGGIAKTALGAFGLEDGGMSGMPSMSRMTAPHIGHMGHPFGAPQGTNGIFTAPTRVNLHKGEAAVPLSYRAGAKVRPSMAALPAAKTRQPYGGGLSGIGA